MLEKCKGQFIREAASRHYLWISPKHLYYLCTVNYSRNLQVSIGKHLIFNLFKNVLVSFIKKTG